MTASLIPKQPRKKAAGRVMDVETGSTLKGTPSLELVRRSAMEGDTGIVPAYRDSDGVWQYVPASEVEHYERNLGTPVRTVWVQG